MKYLTLTYYLILSVFAQGQVRTIQVNDINFDFPELIEENFNIISSNKKTDSLGIDYLIFEIIPKREGLYTITHTFSDIENANNNPTIPEKYTTKVFDIKEINYKSKYVLPVYNEPRQQLYKYKDFYYNTNSPIAFNNIKDTILIPFILCKNFKKQEITFTKFEDLRGWHKEGNDILSNENRIPIDHINNVKEVEVVHFKHSWSTSYHVAHIGTPGLSSIYGVFEAKKKSKLKIAVGEGIEIPIEIIPKRASLKTHYGISCERTELYENGGSLVTTFHKVFAPNTIILREGDIFNVKIKEFEIAKGIEIKLDTIVIEKINKE